MKIFTVYIKQESAEPIETATFIEEGFSLFAFMFNIFWALYHRMWLVAGGVFLVNSLLSYAQLHGLLSAEGALIVNIGMLTIIGFEASDWYQAALKRRGYILLDIVSGPNMEQAQQRFFDYYITQSAMRNA